MGRMVTNPATRKMPLFLILSLWQRQVKSSFQFALGLAATGAVHYNEAMEHIADRPGRAA